MSAKVKTQFFCQECGYETRKWLGKCPGCNAWNTIVEEKVSKASKAREAKGFITLTSVPTKLDEISLDQTPRYETKIQELDRVLGGGIVPGTLTLIGGDPGIGKSTLVLQLLQNLSANHHSVFYVTGEESKEQIKRRADRLKVSADITILAENNMEESLKQANSIKPQILVIDSIQTAYDPHLESAPGSLSQVRECTGKLLYHAKNSLTSVILIGHVTKEGSIAGPKVLEHMVDTVLYFEGESSGQFRILRTIKNRYGSTNEIGVFEMTELGLLEVNQPSQIFLKDRADDRPGSCVTASLEGTRSVLTEIQALVTSSSLANPRRSAIGTDHNRLSLIIAVAEKVAGIKLYDQDIYASAAGGLKVYEPACDLSILMAVVSSHLNRPLSGQIVAIGEIGLSGEIRSVSHLEKRIQEAEKMGYKTVIIPKNNKINPKLCQAELIMVSNVTEALNLL
jgi:DNA repair protein RadA/Sms